MLQVVCIARRWLHFARTLGDAIRWFPSPGSSVGRDHTRATANKKMKFNLVLILIVSLVCFATGQPIPNGGVAPKLRNVDDPNKDPAEYSRQWTAILEQLEGSVRQWQFGARFRQAVESNVAANVSATCLQAMSLYFERPMEQEWSFKSKFAVG